MQATDTGIPLNKHHRPSESETLLRKRFKHINARNFFVLLSVHRHAILDSMLPVYLPFGDLVKLLVVTRRVTPQAHLRRAE